MLLDVSQPVTERTAVFPGDEPFSCGWTASGDDLNVGHVRGTSHVGTHVDAPFHFDASGARVGGLALEAFLGECLVIDAIGRSALDETLLRAAGPLPPRVLFRTHHRDDETAFRRDFPVLTPGAIALLARAGVKLVGIDAPSFDPVDAKRLDLHRALSQAGIVNVENLALSRAEARRYELLAAPVRWIDMDAAPIRAILRR